MIVKSSAGMSGMRRSHDSPDRRSCRPAPGRRTAESAVVVAISASLPVPAPDGLGVLLRGREGGLHRLLAGNGGRHLLAHARAEILELGDVEELNADVGD